MKVKIYVISALMTISLASYSQEIQQRNVPAVVLNVFQLKFPNASDVTWKLEKGNYIVDFETNDKDCKLLINDKGTILKYSRDLYVSEIPGNVLETIKSKVNLFDVGDAVINEEGGKIFYKITMEVNDRKNEFLIDNKGKLLKYNKELGRREVPARILEVIRTEYGPIDIDDAWSMDEAGKINYSISGEISDKDHSFLFDNNSSLIKHEQELRISEVPVLVQNAATSKYTGYELRNADLTEEGGKLTYYLELRRSKEKVFLKVDSSGKISWSSK